jgi:hypothetical protein
MNRFAITLCLLASLATCAQAFGQAPAGHSSSPARVISASERSALVALFEATDGDHWKNHDGWLEPPDSECNWHGVECEPAGSDDAAVVTSVDLMQNNLRGRIPAEIAELAHLETLFLYGNELSGMLPDSMIQRWLSGDLWVNMEAPLLTKVTEIDYEYAASAILCAQHRAILRSDATATLFTERCQNSSPTDRATYCEVKKGTIYGEQFAKLAWTLEKNGFFALGARYDRNVTEAAFVSTRVTREGKQHEVVDYAGGGPLELWIVEATIEGVSSSIDWSTSEALQRCPRWSEAKSPRPR